METAEAAVGIATSTAKIFIKVGRKTAGTDDKLGQQFFFVIGDYAALSQQKQRKTTKIELKTK